MIGFGWPLGLGLLAVGSFLHLLMSFAPSKPRQTGKVIGVVGLMGSGKTLFAVREARRRLKSGARVATNFTLKLPKQWEDRWVRFESWQQLAELRDCVVILDEAHLFAPASNTFRLPPKARWAMSMARKRGLDVYWISQHPNRVTVGLRELTAEIVQCRKTRLWFTAKTFTPESFGKAKVRPLWVVHYRVGRHLGRMYDTSELLLADEAYDSDGSIAALVETHKATASTNGELARRRRLRPAQ